MSTGQLVVLDSITEPGAVLKVYVDSELNSNRDRSGCSEELRRMYCSTCGRAVTPGLSYCNHCGARLNQEERDRKSSELQPGLLVSAICGLFILGLVAITALMGVMKVILQLPVDRVLGFTLPVFLIMVLIEALLIRLLLLRTKGIQKTSETVLAKSKATNELDAVQARALPGNMPSVTEHTTRVLDPMSNDR